MAPNWTNIEHRLQKNKKGQIERHTKIKHRDRDKETRKGRGRESLNRGKEREQRIQACSGGGSDTCRTEHNIPEK